MIELARATTYRLDVDGPLGGEAWTSTQVTACWAMTRATLTGPRIRARSVFPGSDWFTPLGDGWGRPHVRLAFQTDDGATLLLEYRGLVQPSERFTAAVRRAAAPTGTSSTCGC